MTPAQAHQLISDLTDKINYFNNLYYQDGESSLSDDEFDLLLEQLIEMESQFPEFKQIDSPSQRVGGRPINEFESVRHTHPMLSLSNLYARPDLDSWLESVTTRLTGTGIRFGCEVKIDGVA